MVERPTLCHFNLDRSFEPDRMEGIGPVMAPDHPDFGEVAADAVRPRCLDAGGPHFSIRRPDNKWGASTEGFEAAGCPMTHPQVVPTVRLRS